MSNNYRVGRYRQFYIRLVRRLNEESWVKNCSTLFNYNITNTKISYFYHKIQIHKLCSRKSKNGLTT